MSTRPTGPASGRPRPAGRAAPSVRRRFRCRVKCLRPDSPLSIGTASAWCLATIGASRAARLLPFSETRTMAAPMSNLRPASVNVFPACRTRMPAFSASSTAAAVALPQGRMYPTFAAGSVAFEGAVKPSTSVRPAGGGTTLDFAVIGFDDVEHLDVEQQRQAPRGDVVDLVVQAHLAALFLLLDERPPTARSCGSSRLRSRRAVGCAFETR